MMNKITASNDKPRYIINIVKNTSQSLDNTAYNSGQVTANQQR